MELLLVITSFVFIAFVAELLARKKGFTVLRLFVFTLVVFSAAFLNVMVG